MSDIVCPNETKLASLSDLPTETDEQIWTTAEKLINMDCGVVVVTVGERGACVVRAGHYEVFPMKQKVAAVDTVGAGDSFVGKCVTGTI